MEVFRRVSRTDTAKCTVLSRFDGYALACHMKDPVYLATKVKVFEGSKEIDEYGNVVEVKESD